ncbi:hypothetical protein FHS96_004364 [Sphingomonas zeicaulis]|uniref:hypothetical protein n=1 Tax=Sphingomonas zeicaulis TaxID=1632740 RepID=UPI003D2296DD
MLKRLAGTVLIACATLSSPAVAEDSAKPSPLIDVMARCRAITDVAERAACYDGAWDALTEARDRKEVVILDREDMRRTRRGLFGFGTVRLPFFGNGDDEKETPKKIESKITSVSQTGFGRWRIVIEDGAVWETTENIANFVPRKSQSIVITRGAVTNYFVKVGGGRLIPARRTG